MGPASDVASEAQPSTASLPRQRSRGETDSAITPDTYAAIIDSAMKRLVAHVHQAVADGTWAVNETAQLHAWVRAELMPWAAEVLRTSDPAARASLAPAFAELAKLDADLLGTCGRPAAALATKIQDSGSQLLRKLPGI